MFIRPSCFTLTIPAAMTLVLAGTVHAGSACDLLTDAEASRLLGAEATSRMAQQSDPNAPGCVISAGRLQKHTLHFWITTVSREDAPRLLQHMDEARGSEIPSMHGEPWYEISVPDPQHPRNRRLLIHRDRTTLTLDVHSRRRTDEKVAFESIWFDIAQRLPQDER